MAIMALIIFVLLVGDGVTLHTIAAMYAGALQIAQKVGQHAGLLAERQRPCLAMPETTALGVNADLIHRLAHGAPVIGIGDGEQLPLHTRPAHLQGDGAGLLTSWGQMYQPALTTAGGG